MILDQYQEEIANDFEGEIAVVAGPGSGKTRTLIERTERLYKTGKKPQCILLISYTNKVRGEIKKRLKDVNEELEKVNVHTFHSFGVNLLRLYGSLVGVNKNFEIIDDEDSKSILNKIYEELEISKSEYPIKRTLREITTIFDELKEQFDNSEELVKYLSSLTPATQVPAKKVITRIFNYYTFYKRNNNYLDFDDIIVYTNALLYKEEAQKTVSHIEYVMVDEAQDLDTTQYELINLLQKNGISNILLVGDFDQNIYSWRGARTDLFKKFYQNAKKYSLGINYRSSDEIVQCSKKLIQNNKDRIDINLVSSKKGTFSKPICNYFGTNMDEWGWVAKKVKELLDSNVEPYEIAILYRANYLSRGIESELIKNNIKYVIYNGFEFYQRKEIKDCICLLKLTVNKNERIALERILLNLPNIGPRKVENIVSGNLDKLSENDNASLKKLYNVIDTASHMKLISSRLQYMIEELKYFEKWDDGNLEDRIQNYSELLRFIETFDNEKIEIQEFLDNISLLNKRDERANINESIKLMTLHSSKGLEFKYVFIINAVDGIIPNERSINENMLPEERRLMYVGITRAKMQVYITASPYFNYMDYFNSISRFINEAKIEVNDLSNKNYLNKGYTNNSVNTIGYATTNSKNVKKQAKEFLLTFFLGMFGVHHFCKGHTKLGWLYLFTLGLVGYGWLMDVIISLVKLLKAISDKK